MKGDFSRLRFSPHDNFNGILPQQGKVLLDSDGIAQTLIANNWQETAARDWFGEAAGVPAAAADSFKVTGATSSGTDCTLTVTDGHLWADGLLVRLASQAGTVQRQATWLEPPIVATANTNPVAAGTSDAVVLEVWQHAVNGFQMPEVLIEPALGGPDTAERLQTSFAFRLARLAAGQGCSSLAFDDSTRGALTASLVPSVPSNGECPVQGAGGYSGYEHQLYRIEIADSKLAASQFKWSRCNAGLVGRGNFTPLDQKIAITANLPPITSARQSAFYLEIESYDPKLGYSHVIAGAKATLNGSTLQCEAITAFGTYPTVAGIVFFRLWDGLLQVSDFKLSATPSPLENGILLQFDADAFGKYFPGDYWTFPVRAQGLANPQTLINARKPQGIVYHRVPLAEITWENGASGTFTAATIEDCRTILPPLSQVKGCCKYRVGDGVTSFGDFKKIQDAIDALPGEGGEVCILPGHYLEDVRIAGRRNVVIHGCGWQTRIASGAIAKGAPAPANAIAAVFTIVDSQHIKLESFAIEAADREAGILIDGIGTGQPQVTTQLAAFTRAVVLSRGVVDVTIENLVITAATLPALLAVEVQLLKICSNRVAMKNVRSLWPAIYTSGTEIHIERNWVGIQTLASVREWLPTTVVDDLTATAAGSNTTSTASTTSVAKPNPQLAVCPGGIQIGGPAVDVYIIENEIEGGRRNGITLGSFDLLDANGQSTGGWTGVSVTHDGDDCCTGTLQPPPTGPPGGRIVAGGLLVNIQIHRNRIRNMGLCGIGPVAFFDLAQTLEIISIIGLCITDNEITNTVLINIDPPPPATAGTVSYGAISVPDVLNLVIRDNAITDFGAQPGLDVCGIFVLHGELLDISRNKVIESRDLSNASGEPKNAQNSPRGGIVILVATPPVFGQPLNTTVWGAAAATQKGASTALSAPSYEPGLPAARIEHNVVRVPTNYALELFGLGPFEIVNNHLSCGGLVRGDTLQLAQTVLILNIGAAIDNVASALLPTSAFQSAKPFNSTGVNAGVSTSTSQAPSCGAVLFTNNVCQLATLASDQHEGTSVLIYTADHLIFSSNHCWLDGVRGSAFADALLVARSLNAIGNRFQESLASVSYSAITSALVNITGQNISSYNVNALGTFLATNNNIVHI